MKRRQLKCWHWMMIYVRPIYEHTKMMFVSFRYHSGYGICICCHKHFDMTYTYANVSIDWFEWITGELKIMRLSLVCVGIFFYSLLIWYLNGMAYSHLYVFQLTCSRGDPYFLRSWWGNNMVMTWWLQKLVRLRKLVPTNMDPIDRLQLQELDRTIGFFKQSV